MQEYFKIGEISKLYGIGADSLRYYEKIGILRPERSESGYRHYSLQDIWKLNSMYSPSPGLSNTISLPDISANFRI